MGRKKKYNTVAEKQEAQRKWSLEYYHRNKDDINKKTMKEYYEQRIKEMEEKMSKL